MDEELVLPFSADVVARAMWAILAGQGLQVVRSFDLRSALATHPDCPCPHHGTAQCDCQFIVLLVYGETGRPVVVNLHGSDAHTAMIIVPDTATFPDTRLLRQVTAALVEAV